MESLYRKVRNFLVWQFLPLLFGSMVGLTMAMVIGDHIDLTSPKKYSLEDRIKRLTTSLNTASNDISQIEDDVNRRKSLVEKLKTDADTAERLKSLDSKQLEAVSQALRGELDAHYYRDLGVSAFVGALFTKVIDWALLFMRRRKAKPQAVA